MFRLEKNHGNFSLCWFSSLIVSCISYIKLILLRISLQILIFFLFFFFLSPRLLQYCQRSWKSGQISTVQASLQTRRRYRRNVWFWSWNSSLCSGKLTIFSLLNVLLKFYFNDKFFFKINCSFWSLLEMSHFLLQENFYPWEDYAIDLNFQLFSVILI